MNYGIIFRDYISAIEKEVRDDELADIIAEIERTLANPHESRARLEFLRGLKIISESDDDPGGKHLRLVESNLSHAEIEASLRQGMVKSFKDGRVSGEKLLLLMHDLDGMENFFFAMAGTAENKLAAVWKQEGSAAAVSDFCRKSDEAASDENNGREYIIYVDDVAAEAEAVTRVFKARFEKSYRVRGFTSPNEAFDFINRKINTGDSVALVVTDMYMPREFHGDELARKIHMIDPDMPVLGYSGHNSFQDPEQAKSAGLLDLLPKQSTSTALFLETVDSVLNRKSA